ncbi:UDP-glucose 4-epimerase GalE [Alteromonas sp. RKMC-009]|uniref:UDP-glucose 4-epimerase GalE n=1 Tax=Alteromonas sp. RKMC-009 TaxID=2267264 RepID=UPI000E6908E4|nr:UDP-glucose 4-epimerase GalE [Alteromonas sp. RKMC-009]AYA63584.1 UDP-glucose 4-epimerase GalE [Alteromonas sp. RKMC-009]MEC7691647.1 UDP-glucose 4-epimerase GalE [Pseudomonadota bacterium]
MKTILVTGGAGYIGSHTVLQLLEQEYHVVVLDNLVNSSAESLRRVEKITGKQVTFVQGDIRDDNVLDTIFSQHQVNAVIHFAGLKAVGESVQKPLEYYENNMYGTLSLCKAMRKHNVMNLVFSSSATVYGDPVSLPLHEKMATGHPTNPYGMSKLMVEHMLTDLYKSDEQWNIVLLRYFNPVGAHKSGLIGEDPNGIPNNLMPYISQVATGKLEQLSVFGDDYDTEDGTGVRDYIHVEDLANGHLKALDRLALNMGLDVYNLGTGQGYSVLEMIKAFEEASGQTVNYRIAPRRSGDVAACYADPTLAAKELNWHAEKNLQDMCKDVWHWQSNNPKGYQD